MRILVIEDELAMRTALERTLAAEGYRVHTVTDGARGLEMACEVEFDLIILDVMMPELDGFTVCRALRDRGKTVPILMVTAKGQVEDRVNGLDNGADDYLMKPFSLRELLARVRALLRRTDRRRKVPERLKIGTATVDFVRREISRDGATYPLSGKEAGILHLLVQNDGALVTRDRILDGVWKYDTYPSPRTVDNFIASLRSKLEEDPAAPKHLLTVRGAGYRLEE